MARRVSLPSADDLFRPTADPTPPQTGDHAPPAAPAGPDAPDGESPDGTGPGPGAVDEPAGQSAAQSAGQSAGQSGAAAPRGRRGAARPSGRVRHDEKMTVYITSEELLAIEHARLALRSGHGLAVDRGRLVREAVAMVLADFEADGEDSALVRRLTRE